MIDSLNLPLQAASDIKPPSSIFDNALIQYISQFARLSEKEAEDILKTIDIRTFKKGQFLLKEGQIKDLCCFVIKGCVRQYYLIDGEEKTTGFYTEGQPIVPHEGATNNQPAKFFLVCNEDSVVTVGSLVDDATFAEKFPKVRDASLTSLEHLWSNQQEHFANFVIRNPEERYLHLLETRPELLDRVPHYQLASYLGMKPESLSRIRKRIMLK